MSWFKLYRKIFDHEIWENPVDFRLFILILGKAVYQKGGVEVDGIHLTRGQWVRSVRKLQDDLKYKERGGYKKYGLATINRSIKRLVESGMITTTETPIGTLFTVVNYEKYQGFHDSENEQSEHQSEHPETSGTPIGTPFGTLIGTPETPEEPNNIKGSGDRDEDNRNANRNGHRNDHRNKTKKDIRSNKEDMLLLLEEDQTENAVNQIESRFIQRRGRGVFLSPKDIQSIYGLLNEGIPLDIILDGIDEAFDNYRPKYEGDGINAFGYCEKVIRSLYERRKAHAKREASRNVAVHEGNSGENKPVTRGRVGWLNPRRRKEVRV